MSVTQPNMVHQSQIQKIVKETMALFNLAFPIQENKINKSFLNYTSSEVFYLV